MSSFFVSRSAKKAAQRKKNKYHMLIFELARLRGQEAERVGHVQRPGKLTKPSSTKSESEVLWSAKVGEVRNRLSGKKRASKERWNRFAGTESGGGRGL